VVLFALGIGHAQNQHVLGQPASGSRPMLEAMRKAKHFLPSRALPP
jgi:hypothetical protein